MEEIGRYADSVSNQSSGSDMLGSGSARYADDHRRVQVLWLSSALVEELKVPKQWKDITSNRRIRHFNTVAREVCMLYTTPVHAL